MHSQAYLLSLSNDVLNFAKIESGHPHVDLVVMRLAEVVAGVDDLVQPKLRTVRSPPRVRTHAAARPHACRRTSRTPPHVRAPKPRTPSFRTHREHDRGAAPATSVGQSTNPGSALSHSVHPYHVGGAMLRSWRRVHRSMS